MSTRPCSQFYNTLGAKKINFIHRAGQNNTFPLLTSKMQQPDASASEKSCAGIREYSSSKVGPSHQRVPSSMCKSPGVAQALDAVSLLVAKICYCQNVEKLKLQMEGPSRNTPIILNKISHEMPNLCPGKVE